MANNTNGNLHYVCATIYVKDGKMEEFNAAMRTFAPHCQRRYGVRLIVAASPGPDPNLVVNYWRLPERPPVEQIMKMLADDPAAQVVQALVARETHQLLEALPYLEAGQGPDDPTANPDGTPGPPTPYKTVEDDLLIVAETGEIYYLDRAYWGNPARLADKYVLQNDNTASKVGNLVDAGVILATIPDEMFSCLCVLLNLKSLLGRDVLSVQSPTDQEQDKKP